MSQLVYKGKGMARGIRFAPSPTGDFHLGNLRTAWISWKWARFFSDSGSEPWVVRFEDIDRPRVLEGARERQLSDMARLGLVPDQEVTQSARFARHWEVFEAARLSGRIYPCFCSRKEVQDALAGAASAPHGEPPVYNGRCRDLKAVPTQSHPSVAWRFRSPEGGGARDFIVARTGSVSAEGSAEASSFVPSYNWACAIDDYDGDYRLLVRAWDLEHVIVQQRAVHEICGALFGARAYPAVFHASLVVTNEGGRLEKRTRGVTLAELEQAGVSAEALLRIFEKSFVSGLREFSPGEIFGEPRRSITLAELGIQV